MNVPITDIGGRPVPVERVEDVSVPLPPGEFWGRVAAAPEDPAVARTDPWSVPLLRRQFAALPLDLPDRVRRYHQALPRLDPCLGREVDLADPDRAVVIAGDVRYAPPARAHPRNGAYSSRYYPRRMNDWLNDDFLPAARLSADPYFSDRLGELLGFAHHSQYDEAGRNAFVERHDPVGLRTLIDSGLARQWAGGWDYVFDWTWLDAYGYRWRLHEPDHHVCSDLAVALVRAFELTGDPAQLASASLFVERQIPRYGWHTGVWRDRRYYWTEYGPSGPGHPDRDATVNIQALVARAVAMTGFHTGDRRRLEYARGLLWYCVREWSCDGRWYYDGAENPIKQRAAISHDLAVLFPLLHTLPYLLRAGIDVAEEIEVLGQAYDFYRDTWPEELITRVRDGQLTALPAEPAGSGRWRVTSFFTANRDSAHLVVRDALPPASEPVMLIMERVQPWLPPADRGRPLMITTDTDSLRHGVTVPLPLRPGDLVRISYDLGAAPGPNTVVVEPGTGRTVRAVRPGPDHDLRVTAGTFLATAAGLSFPPNPSLGACEIP